MKGLNKKGEQSQQNHPPKRGEYMRHSLTITIIGILVLVSMALVNRPNAIPVFARKYETSCITCHTIFPKLNSFGEAYRLNGFQYPEGDEDQVKDEPISLGSDAYKKVFPHAVWPSDIPGTPPLGIRVTNGFNYRKNEQVKTEFLAPSLIIMTAGTFGENVRFYAGAHLFEEGEIGSIDRAYFEISNLFNNKLPENFLNMRIGQFIPNMVPFANHRGLAVTPYAFNTYSATADEFETGHAHGSESFGIETFQLGVELSGIASSRFLWGMGFVNGSGAAAENSSAKDGYFRAAYKFGGMGYDGSGGTPDPRGRNWIDNSIAVGGFAYFGSYPNDGLVGSNDLTRERYGLDFNVKSQNTNLFGGWIRGKDEVVEGNLVLNKKYNLGFVELNQVIYPWLTTLARYERAEPEDQQSIERVVAGIATLYRANIKFVIESSVDPSNVEFSKLIVRLDFAF